MNSYAWWQAAMLYLGLVVSVVLVLLHPVAASAQSYRTVLYDMRALAAAVDNLNTAQAPGATAPLGRQHDGWRQLARDRVTCSGSPIVNGEATRVRIIGPFTRQDGTDFVILSRGLALEWNTGQRAVSLLLSQRFDARSGAIAGELFLEGHYLASSEAPPVAVVASDRWVDVPARASPPPLHQPWGVHFAALGRHVRTCRVQ